MPLRFSILCLFSAIFWLVGCQSTSERVEIEFWGMGREGEVVGELIPDFERQHPGIKVKVQQIPWSAAHEKLLTAYAGDALPDLWQLGNTWIPEFVALNALEPLGLWIERSQAVEASDYFPGIWATNVLGGQPYGLPWYVDTRLLFYRKDILQKAGIEAPPTTWAAWAEALRRVKQYVGDENFSLLMPTNEFEQVIILALQQEAGMLRDGERYGNFQSEDFRRAFTFYVRCFEEGWAPLLRNTQVSNVPQEFARGYFSFYITGPWYISEFRNRLPDSLQGAWMTAPMPGPDKDTPGVSTAGGASLALNRVSENKEAAWALMEYLTAPAQQMRFHEMTGNLPARKAAWDDPALADNPYADAFRRQLRHVKPTPQVPEWERIAFKISEYAEQVISDRLTVDQALAALDRDVDRLLEKRRWILARQAP